MQEKDRIDDSDYEKKLDEPQLTTYERDELVLEVAFTVGGTPNGSDRNIKENFAPIVPREILEAVAFEIEREN